jgi:hypothetical protein
MLISNMETYLSDKLHLKTYSRKTDFYPKKSVFLE